MYETFRDEKPLLSEVEGSLSIGLKKRECLKSLENVILNCHLELVERSGSYLIENKYQLEAESIPIVIGTA